MSASRWVPVLLWLSTFAGCSAGICPNNTGGSTGITGFCNNTIFGCSLTASNSGQGKTCDTVCQAFGGRCQAAYGSTMCGDVANPLACSTATRDVYCECMGPSRPTGLCTTNMPNMNLSQVCINDEMTCSVMISNQSVSCNEYCNNSMTPPGYCWQSWDESNCFYPSITRPCSDVQIYQLCQCAAYLPPSPYISFRSRGNRTACRAFQGDTAATDGCSTPVGCYYTLLDNVVTTAEQCQDRCRVDPRCIGVEWGNGNKRCELWHQTITTTYFNASGYECFDMIDNRSCPVQPIPSPFRLMNATCFPLRWGSSCFIGCGPEYVPTDIRMGCINGSLAFPDNAVCLQIENAGGVTLVSVHAVLFYDIAEYCPNMTGADPEIIGNAATQAFAANIREALNLEPDNPTVVGFDVLPQGVNATLTFKSGPNGMPTAKDIVNEFLLTKAVSQSSFTDFNISTTNGVCQMKSDIVKVTISFGSLYTYLQGLDTWILLTLCGALLLAILAFICINRNSDHPLALLGAFLSLLSMAAKIVFLLFLWNTSQQLAVAQISLPFFEQAFWIAVGLLGFSFLFNFAGTTHLFRRHALKNYDAFSVWVPKHQCIVAVVLLLCGLNPASFLILCSHSFNLDTFKAPVSYHAQTQFQFVGLVSVLLSDGPPIVLHVLTLLLVSTSQVLVWDGGTNSILFPLIFSVASIIVGLLRRCCGFLVKPQSMTRAIAKSTSDQYEDTPKHHEETTPKPPNE